MMNINVCSRRHANMTDVELIDLAIDEGFDSLAYALACRLEKNLQPKLLNKEELEELDSQLSNLESSISSMRDVLDVIETEAK